MSAGLGVVDYRVAQKFAGFMEVADRLESRGDFCFECHRPGDDFSICRPGYRQS
jgi:hypothetical protein